MIRSDHPTFRQWYARLAPWGQEHVLRWWDQLTEIQRDELVQDLDRLDLAKLDRLFRGETVEASPEVHGEAETSSPAFVVPLPRSDMEKVWEEEAVAYGVEALRAGRVAVVMVAGGQGSRLGHAGPKGTFPVGPVSNKSLFQIHAEKVAALGRRYGAPVPLYIMTSPENHRVIREFFIEHEFFGLDSRRVVFFQQGMFPAVDCRTGKLLMAQRHRIAMSPNGHGGVLQALSEGGHLRDMLRQGVHEVFYFQVDNPLVKIADPAFLGYHLQAEAEMSLKVVRRREPQEKLGVVVERKGLPRIIEYSDLPLSLAQHRTDDGELALWAGSIAVHWFNVEFLERLAEGGAVLPYHRATKAMAYLDDEGRRVWPDEPNAAKFETFIFDALPRARNALVVETQREEEFEPLKNAFGENSPDTVRRAMSDQFTRWLKHAGVETAMQPDGSGPIPVEISPLLALDAEELRIRLAARDLAGGRIRIQRPITLDLRTRWSSLDASPIARARKRYWVHPPTGRKTPAPAEERCRRTTSDSLSRGQPDAVEEK